MANPCGTFAQSYAEDNAIIRTRLQWGLLIAGIIFLGFLPLFCGAYLLHWFNYIGVTIIAVLGLNILTGYTGLISLGHAAFVAIGAYTSALLTIWGLPFWVALPCAGLMAGVVGVVSGLPSLRIKGFYLVMATMAAQFIIMYIIAHWYSVTGGSWGLHGIPHPTLGGIVFRSELSFYYLILAIALTAIFFAKNLCRMNTGRSFIAIRDNDLAAGVMGINILYYKLLAFFIGCFFAGVSGAVYAHWMGGLSPDQFTFFDSIWYLGYIIVGGMGTTLGPILGVFTLVFLSEGLTSLATTMGEAWPLVIQYIAPLREAAFGLVIILFLIFEPKGMAHRWELIKTYYRKWPYSY